MSKNLQPKIRFKGFSDNWQLKMLGEVTEVYDGIHHTPNYTDSGIMFLSVENIKTLESNKFISKEDFIKDYKIYPQKYDVLMTRIGDVGTTNIVISEKLLAYYVSLALLKPKNINSFFLVIALASARSQQDIWKRTLHIAFPKKINKNEITLVEICHPFCIKEQQQIGDFFQSIDKDIALQEEKLNKTKNLKRAMLEKMFPKEGSKQPELRFKGFSGDWENSKILDLSDNKTLNNGVFNDQLKVGKGYKLINVIDMYIDSHIDEKRLSLLDLSVSEFNKNKVKYGDIFFTRSSIVKSGIAFSNVYLGNSDDITYDGHLIKLSPNLSLVDPMFLNVCLKTDPVRKQLIQYGKTATMTTIGQLEVGKTVVYLPLIQEQEKIGNYFKKLDKAIALQSEQLEKLKNIKKAYLAKMFV